MAASPTSHASNPEFYLRAWFTQAIPPNYTFGWLPPITISNGTAIDGNVAVPAIYPGPLLVMPVARSISDDGIARIVDEARQSGLLSGQTDFTGGSAMPGAKLGQIDIVVDGTAYQLTGDPNAQLGCTDRPCAADPGSPQAFAAFWSDITDLDTWLPGALGQSRQYSPERIALLLGESGPQGVASLPPNEVEWPLSTPLADAGVPYPGDQSERCLTLTGDDLATMLPVLQHANQLTQFVDGSVTRWPTARVLVPGEPSPCGD